MNKEKQPTKLDPIGIQYPNQEKRKSKQQRLNEAYQEERKNYYGKMGPVTKYCLRRLVRRGVLSSHYPRFLVWFPRPLRVLILKVCGVRILNWDKP